MINLPTLTDIEREKARRNLLSFVVRTFNYSENRTDESAEYSFNWFHKKVCSSLDNFLKRVINKESPRLMIFAPPRHGKSELVSRRLPAYSVGKYPHLNIIATSYGKTLSEAMSKDVQQILTDSEYKKIFPDTRIKSTLPKNVNPKRRPTQTNESFEILNKQGVKTGEYYSVGVNGGTTGRGADIFIIDDVIKDYKEAVSPTYRDNVDNWFKAVAYTRLAPGGGIIIIMTRWHDDDLAGRLKKAAQDDDGEPWEILDCKAIAEQDEEFRKKGEALHPERYPIKALNRIKRVLKRFFESLYQQNPMTKEGGLFYKHYFTIVDNPPPKLKRVVRYWDRAATVKEDGKDPDFTAGVKIGEDYNGHFYILDVITVQDSPLKVDRIIKNTATQDGKRCKIGISEDPGQAGIAQTEHHKQLLSGFKKMFRRETGSKVLRAEGTSLAAEEGDFSIIRAPWNDSFLDVVTGFPFGAHDDQVDAFVGAHVMITNGKCDLMEVINNNK